MKNSIAASLAFIVVFCIQVNAQTLEKVWEVTGLEAPESIIHDAKAKMYYVSNIVGSPIDKDGNGYISKVDETGKISAQKWVTGLNAPKGMGISKGKLYVADIDAVAVIDIASGKIEQTIPAQGAGFLNDVAVSEKGDVYISDTFGGNTIFRIQNGKIERWLQDDKLDFPNGLFIKGNDIIVASWGVVTDQQTFATAVKGKLVKVSIADKKISDISGSFANGDGIAAYKDGYLVSDWAAGKIFFVDGKAAIKEIGSYNQGTADMQFITSKKLLLVPQMTEGKILAFQVK
jgi:sugar lactone lactonase YvrE